jgi:hypothetical protein
MSKQNQPQKEENQQQQQPMMKSAAVWPIDVTSICGDGNDQNAADLRVPTLDLDCSAGALLGQSAPNPIAALHNIMPSFLSIVDDGIKDALKVELEERELWQKFHPLVNEMIITKSGRSVQGIGIFRKMRNCGGRTVSSSSAINYFFGYLLNQLLHIQIHFIPLPHNFPNNFRRLFPALKVKLFGQDKTANYYVIMVSSNGTFLSQMAFSIHFHRTLSLP